MKSIEDTLKGIIEKRERVNELYDKLERSFALQKLCPDAFEHGKCSAYWMTDKDRKPVFQLAFRDGSTITFPFDEVSDFFKLDEAAKRGITAHTSRVFGSAQSANNVTDPVGAAIFKFLRMRAMKERRDKRGFN
jgi:hypothetical protein